MPYDVWNDNLPYEDYKNFIREVLKLLYEVLAPDGRLVINHYLSCGSGKHRFAPLMDINSMAQEIGFKHHGIGIWLEETVSKLTAWGSWCSPSAPYVNSPLEGFLILYKERWKRISKGKVTLTKDEFITFTKGVWKFQPEKRKEHPAPYPESIVKMIINCLTYEDDLVLDPFAGSGTTLVVAERLKRGG